MTTGKEVMAEVASRAERERHGQPEETPGEARRRMALAHVRGLIDTDGGTGIDAGYLGTVLAEAQATDAVRAEFAAFKANALKIALRRADELGWCEEIYDLLRQVGYGDDELPVTHVNVVVTRQFRIKLPRVGEVESLAADQVERVVREHFRDHDLLDREFKIVSPPPRSE